MENINGKRTFLPYSFKMVGLILIALTIIFAIITKAAHIEYIHVHRSLFRTLTLNALILSLLFITMSKDKVEDEMTLQIRLRAMSFAFLWGVCYVVLMPFIDILFNDPVRTLSAQQLVLSMLIFYLLMYYIQKATR